jgi:large subunit ribosomal protein L35
MKQKTHSGAKKRLRVTGGGRVKRGQAGLRHLLENKSSGRKRQLGMTTYIHVASAYQVERLLVTKRTKTRPAGMNRPSGDKS